MATGLQTCAAGVAGWMAGIAWLLQRPLEFDQWPEASILGTLGVPGFVASVVAVVMVGLVVEWGGRWRRGRLGTVAPRARVALLLGAAWLGASLGHDTTGARTVKRLAGRVPETLQGQVMVAEGTLVGLARRSAQGQQMAMVIERLSDAHGQGVSWRGTVALVWWQGVPTTPAEAGGQPVWEAGQRWRMAVRLRRPHGPLNPYGFDREGWFLEQGYAGSAQVVMQGPVAPERLGVVAQRWLWPDLWRARLRQRIETHIAEGRLAGLVAGMVVGDQASVDPADWALFRDTGVAHVLSVSGLHITAFFSLVCPLAAAAWRRFPRGCERLPAPWVGGMLGCAAAALFALVAGWELPAQRTVGMLVIAFCVRLVGGAWPMPWVWGAALLPILVWDPWAVGQASFWLSFAAVGLLVAQGGEPPAPGLSKFAALLRFLRAQATTCVALAPLAALCFHQFTWVSIIANAVVVPWLTLVLTPLAMLGVVVPWVWSLVEPCMVPVDLILARLAALPGAQWTLGGGSVAVQLLALAGALVLVLPIPRLLRALGLVWMLPLAAPTASPVPWGVFEAISLDVGQGAATLIRTQHHTVLIDAGPASEASDAGARIVVPVLQGLGVQALDLLVITHRDADHAGGAPAIVARVPPKRILGRLEASHPLRNTPVAGSRSPPPFASCHAGQSWVWDGVHWQVLGPPAGQDRTRTRSRASTNAASCVLRITDARGHSLLAAGDIGHAEERHLLSEAPLGWWHSAALLVPHHGSRHASSAAWVVAVSPRWAHVQSGLHSSYGHPATEVVDRYRAAGAQVTASPACGAWIWVSDGLPRCWRSLARRLWHDRLSGP